MRVLLLAFAFFGAFATVLTNPTETDQQASVAISFHSFHNVITIAPGECVAFENTEAIDCTVHLERDDGNVTIFSLDPDEVSECFQYDVEGTYNYVGFAKHHGLRRVEESSKKSKGKKGKSKGKGPDFGGSIVVQSSTTAAPGVTSSSDSSDMETDGTDVDSGKSKGKSKGKSQGESEAQSEGELLQLNRAANTYHDGTGDSGNSLVMFLLGGAAAVGAIAAAAIVVVAIRQRPAPEAEPLLS